MQASGIEIRRSAPDDAEGFRSCFDAVARERHWLAFVAAPTLEDVRRYLGSSGLLAVREGRIVGWCDVTRKPHPGFQHSGVLGACGPTPGSRDLLPRHPPELPPPVRPTRMHRIPDEYRDLLDRSVVL